MVCTIPNCHIILKSHIISMSRKTRAVLLLCPVLPMGSKPWQKAGSLTTLTATIMAMYIFMTIPVTAGIGKSSPKPDLYLNMATSPGLPLAH